MTQTLWVTFLVRRAQTASVTLSDFDRSRLVWWGLGATLAGALAFVTYSFVGTVVFGIFLYYATRPVYRRLRRRLGNRTLAAGVAIGALAAPALGLAGYALALVAAQTRRLIGEVSVIDLTLVPGVDGEMLELLSDPAALLALDWMEYISAETIVSAIESLGEAADTLAVFGVGLLHVFVMLAIAFYALRDGEKLNQWVSKFGDDRGVTLAYVDAVDRDLKNIFFGNILNAVFTGTIGVVAYSTLNLFAPPESAIPAAALVGLLAGVASLIPVVGMKLVYVPVAAFMGVRALATGTSETLWFVAAFVVVSFVVVDTIPDLLLRPYVSGRSLHVGSVMLAYTLGPLLFGWYGIFLLPILLVLCVQFARIVLPELVSGRSIRPFGVDPGYLDDSAIAADPGAGSGRRPTTREPPAADGGPDTASDAAGVGGGSDDSADAAAGGGTNTSESTKDTAESGSDPFEYDSPSDRPDG